MADDQKDSPRGRQTAIGLLGALAANSAGFGGADVFGRLSDGMGKPKFPKFEGLQEGHTPILEKVIKRKSNDPLLLDRQKLKAERARTGVKIPAFVAERSQLVFDSKSRPAQMVLDAPDAPTAFHELGHATQPKVLTRLHGLLGPGADRGLDANVGDGLRAGFLMGALSNPSGGVGKVLHDNAALLTGLTEIPTLMNELRASYSALKGLHAVGGKAAVRGGIKQLAPALASYIAGAAGHVGAVALARHIAGGHEKTAAGAPGTAPAAGAAPAASGGAKAPTLGVPKAPAPPKVTGALRLSSVAANATPIGQLKPKTTPPHPGNRRGNFPGIPTAKPPSLTGYYRDTLDSMDAPSRGTRT
jgi:hypothetical protein